MQTTHFLLRSIPRSRSVARRFTCGAAAGLAAVAVATPAQAAFHLWNLREIYSDASGTVQFIELFTSASGQTFVGGQQIQVNNVGNTLSHTFTIPNNLSGSTANHAFLFGTAGLLAAGGPTPDFILPDNFLFTGGGTITFFGANGGAYTALPLDGLLSRVWGDGNAANSPQNFAGQIGMAVVPEPAALGLLGLAGLGFLAWLRRRSTV